MKEFLFTLLVGIVAGTIDILPMIKMKLDKYSIISAFTFYLILPFIVLNIDLFGIVWWLKGGIAGVALALPTIILVAKDEKNSVPPMIIMSILLGTLISTVGHYII